MLLPQTLVLMLLMLQVQMQPVDNVEPVPEDDSNNNRDNNNMETNRVLYDQRQTGKYNIHVSIKDVAIIEVDQNELADESYNAEDDDYYYDDSALTIKPIKFTTEASSAATTTATATATTTTTATSSTTTTTEPAVAATVAAVSGGNISAYSAQLLADIAATQRQKPKTNNLIIMDATPQESSTTLLPKWLHARSKDEPITTTTTAAQSSNIEYTPSQGHDSPIFKVKVQRAANPTASSSINPNPTTNPSSAETSTRCRTHQFRDAQGKCRTKRSGSILRKLFSMLVSLPFANNRHGHGLQVSPP